jgi:hypothetical protein
MNCTTCPDKIWMCCGCHNRNYNAPLEPGHVLQLSRVSCVQCRTILVNVDEVFPQGTLSEDITQFSNEFFSCCSIGCSSFVRVQHEEGVMCADRPNQVQNIHCEYHAVLLNHKKEDMVKPCPGCHNIILKDGGCNHMTCSSCRREFCMRPGCPYDAEGGIYTHGYYCRHGISDELTVKVLVDIVSLLKNFDRFNSGGNVKKLRDVFTIKLDEIEANGLPFALVGRFSNIMDHIVLNQRHQLQGRGTRSYSISMATVNDLATTIETVYPQSSVRIRMVMA